MRRLSSLAVLVGVLIAFIAGGLWAWSHITSLRDQGQWGGAILVPAAYTPIIREAATRCPQVPVEILAAQLAAESGWDASAVSPAGAEGIAQFMPSTWRQYGIDGDADGIADVWNPTDAIHSAAALNCVNRRLVRSVQGLPLHNILAAYNAGHGAVRKYEGVPPFPETEAYVARILDWARTLEFEEPR